MHFPLFSPKAVFVFVLFPLIALGADIISPADQVLSTAKQLIDEKKYAEAVSLLESTRVQSVRQNDECSEALILNLLGEAYEQQGKYVAARNAFDGSISKLAHAKGKNTPELIQPLNSLSNLLYESDQGSQAEGLVRRSLGILRAAGAPDGDTGAELALIARIYLRERKLSAARQSAQASLDLLRHSGHSEELPAAVSWSVLGGVYDAERDSERAEHSLKQALSILTRILDPQDFRVGEAVANLGLLYASQGLPEQANPLLEQAHECFRANALNTLFVRNFLLLWADLDRKTGHKDKAKDLTKEANILAGRSEASISAYVVDANSFR